jgi:hypothetical protein
MTFRLGPVLSLLLGSAVLFGAVHFFMKGSGTTDLTQTGTGPIAQAYDTQAAQDFQSASTATQAYYADNSTYDGMTAAALRANYDAAFPNDVVVAAAAGASYCLQATLGTETYSQHGPGAPVTPAPC